MCVSVAKVARQCRTSIDIEGAARYQSMKPMAIAIARRCGNDDRDDDEIDDELDDDYADAIDYGVGIVTATLELFHI